MSDFEDLCDSMGLSVGDPDAIDKIIDYCSDDHLDYYPTEMFLGSYSIYLDYIGAVQGTFQEDLEKDGVGKWVLHFLGKDYTVKAEKFCIGEGSTDDCDVFKFVCDMDQAMCNALAGYAHAKGLGFYQVAADREVIKGLRDLIEI